MRGCSRARVGPSPDFVLCQAIHDHGTRYLGKMFNDEWMREKGFIEKHGMRARDLVASAAERGQLQGPEGDAPEQVAGVVAGAGAALRDEGVLFACAE